MICDRDWLSWSLNATYTLQTGGLRSEWHTCDGSYSHSSKSQVICSREGDLENKESWVSSIINSNGLLLSLWNCDDISDNSIIVFNTDVSVSTENDSAHSLTCINIYSALLVHSQVPCLVLISLVFTLFRLETWTGCIDSLTIVQWKFASCLPSLWTLPGHIIPHILHTLVGLFTVWPIDTFAAG